MTAAPMSKSRIFNIIRGLCLGMALAALATPALADRVERRGAEGRLDGRISRLDDAGVWIAVNGSQPRVIPWDRVRQVAMDRPDPALDRYMQTATNLWRARTRLERHDPAMAEPLFDRLFETYRGQTHETALVVAEGLLRCKLARGAHDAAVIPALETARLRRALPDARYVYNLLPPVLDEGTSLCIALAPVWPASAALDRLERELQTYDAKGDPVVAMLAWSYAQAVRYQLGRTDQEASPPRADVDHPGVQLMLLLLELRSTDPQRRLAARERLSRDHHALPAWTQAWSHYCIGEALLAEQDRQLQQRGLLSLVHLPAQFAGEQPYLAGLALARMADALEAQGDSAGADALRTELQKTFPNHPAGPTNPRRAGSPAKESI